MTGRLAASLALAILLAAAPPSMAAALPATAAAASELEDVLRRMTAERASPSRRLRARVSTRGGDARAAPQVLQALIRSRDSGDGATEWTSEVLWPKSLAGWAQRIHVARDGIIRVTRTEPGGEPRDVPSSSDVSLLPGATMTLGDVTEEFWTWPLRRQVGREILDGRDCLLVEFRRQPEGVGFVRAWIARKEALVLRAERVDAALAITRRATASRIMRTDDGWVAATLLVEDVTAARSSEIEFSLGNQAARRAAPDLGSSRPER